MSVEAHQTNKDVGGLSYSTKPNRVGEEQRSLGLQIQGERNLL